MFTRIAQELAELAEQLDAEGLYRQSDQITETMIHVAGLSSSTEKAIIEYYNWKKSIKHVKQNFPTITKNEIRKILKKNKVLQNRGNQPGIPKTTVRLLKRTVGENGITVKDVASIYKISPKTVKRLLKTKPEKSGPKPKTESENSPKTPGVQPAISQGDFGHIVTLLKKGVNAHEIIRNFGINKKTWIYKYLNNPEIQQLIEEQINSGISTQQLANLLYSNPLNISRKIIQKY